MTSPNVQLAQPQRSASVMGLESAWLSVGKPSSVAVAVVAATAGLATASIAAKEPAQPNAVNTVCLLFIAL